MRTNSARQVGPHGPNQRSATDGAAMIVDTHVHLYPPEVNRAPAEWAAGQGEHHWHALCARVRKNGRAVQAFPSLDELLRAMDAAGVERAVLQSWYWEKHDTCVAQNRFFAECLRAHRDRLSACATFHPGAGVAEISGTLHRAKDDGFSGLGELSPHSQLFSIDDGVWRHALELAGELDFPVMLHVTDPASKSYPGRVLTPLEDFVRLAQRHARTTFVLAHWGARLSMDPELGATVRGLRNVFFDTAASPLLYDFGVFAEMTAAVGADRILFGSDFPLVLFPAEEREPSIASFVERIRGTTLSAPELNAIFTSTARRVYRV